MANDRSCLSADGPIRSPINSLARIKPIHLRIALACQALIGAGLGIMLAVKRFQFLNDDGVTNKMKLMSYVSAGCYIAFAVLILGCPLAATLNRPRSARINSIFSFVAFMVGQTGAMTEIISHFVNKNDIKTQCRIDELARTDPTAFCDKEWKDDIQKIGMWVMAVINIAGITALLALAYSRQLSDPERYVQARSGSPESVVALQPYVVANAAPYHGEPVAPRQSNNERSPEAQKPYCLRPSELRAPWSFLLRHTFYSHQTVPDRIHPFSPHSSRRSTVTR
ncbi:hypothetical protein BDY24DRAFT_441423 [Mrakia frigida]|uniref:uncharacterized protein n=1 Tax=Mrakia frigida TaxID=29902 RepID=UPI003FCBFD00